MAGEGVSAKGTTLTIGGVAVATLTNITGPSMSRATIDVGSHADTAYIPFVSGLSDPGEVTMEGTFDGATGQEDLVDHFESGALATFVITYPSSAVLSAGATWTFSGFVTAFSTAAPYDGALTFTASIKVSGEAVFAEGTAEA